MFDLDETLTAVMDCVDELRDNQAEPLGLPADPARAHALKRRIAGLLGEIASAGPTPGLREIARLRRGWILANNDDVKQDELAREVAQVRIRYPVDEGYTFDVGYLVNDEGLQGRMSRREARRYSGWIRTKHAAGEALIADMLSVDELNEQLPAAIRPDEAHMKQAVPPKAYHVYNAVRFAGEAGRAEHIANFWPEDEGSPPKGQKWTAIYANLYTQRFRTRAMPLMQRHGSLSDVAVLLALPDAQLDHHLICIIRGHELGHFAGPVPLRLTGYQGFEGIYPIVEELRADATWLFASSRSPKLIPDEAAWHDHMRVFWAEALRYINRDVHGRADSASMLAALNFMRARGAITTGTDLRMHFDFERMRPAIDDLVVRATHLIQRGERTRANAFFAEHGYDLDNRRAVAPDAFVERVLSQRHAEEHAMNISG
ncbi:MAG: hypothetical protein M1546_02010 [Chloroflexi bacterium]|nr:hypothetical protein [Chloroflexota bacterium]